MRRLICSVSSNLRVYLDRKFVWEFERRLDERHSWEGLWTFSTLSSAQTSDGETNALVVFQRRGIIKARAARGSLTLYRPITGGRAVAAGDQLPAITRF